MMNYFDDNSVVHDDNSSTAHADSLLRIHDEQSQSALSFGVEKVPVALVRGFGNWRALEQPVKHGTVVVVLTWWCMSALWKAKIENCIAEEKTKLRSIVDLVSSSKSWKIEWVFGCWGQETYLWEGVAGHDERQQGGQELHSENQRRQVFQLASISSNRNVKKDQ